MKEDTVLDFAKALVDPKRNLRFCSTCGHITDIDPCHICQDNQRDVQSFVLFRIRKMLLLWKK